MGLAFVRFFPPRVITWRIHIRRALESDVISLINRMVKDFIIWLTLL